ncbi:MAG: hypothetical protein BGN88_08400 [Clostridiales bacterium 43-6]|nr:MAG: hypothetical protein BGN88_08400 [Clostridiales bacterium 43-6]
MEYILPIALVVIAITAIAVVVVFLRKRTSSVLCNAESTERATPTDMLAATGKHVGELSIPIELLPTTTQIDENSLVEIKDCSVVARISQTLPAVAEIANRTLTSNATNAALQQTAKAANVAIQKTNQALQSGNIYRAVIPAGAKLTDSQAMEGAKRAIFHGAKGIKGQANLVPVTAQKASEVVPANIAKTAKVANVAANVMNVASLVVGQYYMSLIDSKLEALTKSISKISDFQDREFKSRILSVITLVSEISQFSTEILEDDSQRKLKLSALEGIKATATELLGQVNITITDITKKNPNPDYKEYESVVEELKTLVGFQNVLAAVLEEISKLTYLLGKCTISTEQSYALYNKYTEMSEQTRTLLSEWHSKQVDALRIDLSKERVAKTGIKAVISIPLGWIDEKHNYKAIKKAIAQEIASQANHIIGKTEQPRDVYAEDVELIIKEGKYYYLPKPQTADVDNED